MTKLIRVNAILEHQNGLARDTAINTFHFLVGDNAAAEAADVFDHVIDFYTATPTGGDAPVSTWIAPTHDTVFCKAYVVNDTIVNGKLVSNSGEPVATSLVASLGNNQGNQPLPAEVAVCLSLRDTVNVGTPKARRTGRIYIGPLSTNATEPATGVDARPRNGLKTNLINAANVLKDSTLADNGAVWVVYSRPYGGRAAIERPGRTTLPALAARPGTTAPITQVWVDDAFDTQRRRGVRATGKSILAV